MLYDNEGECMDCRGWEIAAKRQEARIAELEKEISIRDNIIVDQDREISELRLQRAGIGNTSHQN